MNTDTASQNIGSSVTFIIKFLDVLCFLLAVVFTSLFLIHIIPISTSVEYIVLIIALVLSAIVLKQDIILWIISEFITHKSSNTKPNSEIAVKLFKKLKIGTLILPIVRTLVFNMLAQSFPIILITIVSFVIASFGGFISISADAWTIIGMVGVLLTLFRFYVNSKQNAAEKTIDNLLNVAKSKTLASVSHQKFREWMETENQDDHHTLHIINTIFDTQRDVIKAIENYSKLNAHTRKSRGWKVLNVNKLVVHPQVFPDMDSFYYQLEHSNATAGKGSNSKLQDYYRVFFLEYCFGNIKRDLYETFEFREVGRIIVTNISLIDETGASFSNITNFKKFWEYFGDEGGMINAEGKSGDGKNDGASKGLNTASDYVEELINLVLKFIFQEVFMEYRKDADD